MLIPGLSSERVPCLFLPTVKLLKLKPWLKWSCLTRLTLGPRNTSCGSVSVKWRVKFLILVLSRFPKRWPTNTGLNWLRPLMSRDCLGWMWKHIGRLKKIFLMVHNLYLMGLMSMIWCLWLSLTDYGKQTCFINLQKIETNKKYIWWFNSWVNTYKING